MQRWDSAVRTMRIALDRYREIESRRPLVKDEEEQRKSSLDNLAEWERR